MTTELIKELVGLAVEKADNLNALLDIQYINCYGVTVKIYTSSVDVAIIKADRKKPQTPAKLQAAIDKVKAL